MLPAYLQCLHYVYIFIRLLCSTCRRKFIVISSEREQCKLVRSWWLKNWRTRGQAMKYFIYSASEGPRMQAPYWDLCFKHSFLCQLQILSQQNLIVPFFSLCFHVHETPCVVYHYPWLDFIIRNHIKTTSVLTKYHQLDKFPKSRYGESTNHGSWYLRAKARPRPDQNHR